MSEKFVASNGCSFNQCIRDAHAQGLCDGHYWQARNGRPLTPLRSKRLATNDEAILFWARVDKSDECWEWRGALDGGYGAVQWRGAVSKAHRVAFELESGPIPDGMMIDHVCRNRACVKPAHLRLATPKQNAENKGAQANSKSGIRGVRRDRRGKRWVAAVRHFGVEHRVPGSFGTAEEAGIAAAGLRRQLFTHSKENADV